MIKAIETRYSGYRFRSRLEARWAVFFDALGIAWDYEPEGFELPDGTRYLPDFWLPEFHYFVEIKPLPLGFDGQPWVVPGTKEAAFANIVSPECEEGAQLPAPYTGASFIVLFGTPGPVGDTYAAKGSYAGAIPCDSPYLLCECASCGALGFQFDGRDGRNAHKPSCTSSGPWAGDKGTYNYDSPRILRAAELARSARFEHGAK